jgi:hypothetical protein
MFLVGQKIWHRRGEPSGTVLECDGDRVYLQQDNGAEVDFLAADLRASPPEAAVPRIAHSKEGHVVPNRVITPRDITPEHQRVLDTIPARTMQAIADLFEFQPKAGKFSAQDAAAKLNFITEITIVPYRTMRTYVGRPGELGLLMGKGIADRQRGR